MNKHFILGTAGHIDHGKTALIKALTEIDCDTHPEEKLRGITINLGFAHLDFPNGTSIGIVDVPGHKDFVNTMISGACGIDLVIFVIAADSGVMSQTIEHLHIMQMLGIKSGIIVITKTDLADEEMLMIVVEDIKELIHDTFLDGCLIFKVSSKSGEGIEQLKQYLSQTTLYSPAIDEECIFRMFIDRVFSVAGFGTVVTGSVLSGRLRVNDKVFLLPPEKELRIRRLEKHGREVQEVIAGDRAAINLLDLKKEEFKKGMVLCEKIVLPTSMIDVKIKIISFDKKIDLWSQLIFLSGTFETQVKVHLIDADKLKCGETAFAQIHLVQPFIAQTGDKFILRNSSGNKTIGGGEIIDPYPLHHRRRTEKVISQLKNISEGSLQELVAAEVRKNNLPVTLDCILNKLNFPQSKASEFSPSLLSPDISCLIFEGTVFMIPEVKLNKLKNRIIKTIENYHKNNPLYPGGKNFDELMGLFGINRNDAAEGIMKCLLGEMESAGILRFSDFTWALKEHKTYITDEDIKHINFIETFHLKSGMQTPLMSELILAAHKFGISEVSLKKILTYLAKKKILINIDGNFIHRDIMNRCREMLINNRNKFPEGITVAQFRDLINGNRKMCLLLLNCFDREGLTTRYDDIRFIIEEEIEIS